MQKLKVTTADLQPGMYIAQLDRPWLEAPFKEHGFQINQESEVDQLRNCCRHVYVDISRSNISAADLDRLLAGRRQGPIAGAAHNKGVPRESLFRKAAAFAVKLDPTGVLRRLAGIRGPAPCLTSLKSEMPAAIEAFENAVAVAERAQRCARKDRTIDLDEFKQVVGPLIDSICRNPGAMAWFSTLSRKTEYAHSHSVASALWAVVLGRHLKLDRASLEILAVGGMLLDIGKVLIPSSILTKATPLSGYEKDFMQRHVDLGLEIIAEITGIGQGVVDMVAAHHERKDGSGYPAGLKGDKIPVFGQIAALADCYDAMISDREYAQGVSPHEAVEELNRLSGKQFEHDLVNQFVQAIGVFPSGSLVELNSGEVGLVIEQNGLRRLRPKLMVFTNRDLQLESEEQDLDLSAVSSDSRKPASRWIVKGLPHRYYGADPANFFL